MRSVRAAQVSATEAIGRRAFECLRLLRSRPLVVLDDRFGSDLRQIIADEPIDHRHPWDC